MLYSQQIALDRYAAWGARGTMPTSGMPLKYSNFSMATSSYTVAKKRAGAPSVPAIL